MVVILEVGLGGRLDASNCIDSDVAVITTIGLDHQAYLGYSLEAIGTEKAGIMRSGCPVVYGAIAMPTSVQKQARQLNATLFRRGLDFDGYEQQGMWSWSGGSRSGTKLIEERLPLPALELDNAITALQVLPFLPKPVPREAGGEWFKNGSRYRGGRIRITWLNNKNQRIEVLLDVSHNPQAVERLAVHLNKNKVTGITRAVMAIASDKDHMSVLMLLFPHIEHWFVTTFDSPRALATEGLVSIINEGNGCNNVLSND